MEYRERQYPMEQAQEERPTAFEEVHEDEQRQQLSYNQKEVEVYGKKYILQKMPVEPAMKLRQGWQDENGVNEYLMVKAAIENIVVSPKMTLNDFDTVQEADALAVKAIQYQYGEPDIKN